MAKIEFNKYELRVKKSDTQGEEFATVLVASEALNNGIQDVVIPISSPPFGKYRIVNLYFDPDTQTMVCEYDDTPIE